MLNVTKLYDTAICFVTVAKHEARKINRRIVALPSTTHVRMFRNTLSYNRPVLIDNIILIDIGIILKDILRNCTK